MQQIFEDVGGMRCEVPPSKATHSSENLSESQLALSSEIPRDPTSCCGWGLTHFWQTDAVLNGDEVINICKYFIWKQSQYGQAQKTPRLCIVAAESEVGADQKLKTSLVWLFAVAGLSPMCTHRQP